jgi:signal transduction histidine kinase
MRGMTKFAGLTRRALFCDKIESAITMPNVPVPYDKLHTFRKWLGIGESEIAELALLKDLFVGRKDRFARYFRDFFTNIPEAKLIIEHEKRPGHLLEAWAHWFESLFSRGLDEEFMAYLWRVGAKHVEIKLDKRFSNMGFSVVRQFCQEVILSELPAEKATEAIRLVDKLVDFCLLVETDAYLETTTRCDTEIIRGIADRIRNPVTVIGGNIHRLMKNADVKDPAYPVYEFIFSQSTKCERMVRDIKTYMEVFEREPSREKVSLEDLLGEVLEGLFTRGKFSRPRIEIEIAEGASHVLADRKDMKALFWHLLENSLEALDRKDPFMRISSRLPEAPSHSIVVEIFNSGPPLETEDMEKFFSPFYSTKPEGTGFGLAIARQAVRNNMGQIRLEPVKGEGTRVVLSLPLFE